MLCKSWTSLNFYAYAGATFQFSYIASILFTREKYHATVEIHLKTAIKRLIFFWRDILYSKPSD